MCSECPQLPEPLLRILGAVAADPGPGLPGAALRTGAEKPEGPRLVIRLAGQGAGSSSSSPFSLPVSLILLPDLRSLGGGHVGNSVFSRRVSVITPRVNFGSPGWRGRLAFSPLIVLPCCK